MQTDFGKFLRAIRTNSGDKASDMAKKLFISPSYLNMIENGERNIPKEMEKCIVQAYSLSDSEVEMLHKIIIEEQFRKSKESLGFEIEDFIPSPAEAEKSPSKAHNIKTIWIVAAVSLTIALLIVAFILLLPVSDLFSASEKVPTVQELISEYMQTTITAEDAVRYRELDLPTLREKIQTIGDAVLFLDTINARFQSGITSTYNPETNLQFIFSQNFTDSTLYTFLVGYFVSDTMPDIECVYTAFAKGDKTWPYACLLIPVEKRYLIFSPGMVSTIKDNYNCNIGLFTPTIINSKDELAKNLVSTGLIDYAEINILYLFTPDEQSYSFYVTREDIYCATLTPFYKKESRN